MEIPSCSEKDIDRAFRRLIPVLKVTPLPTEAGPKRIVDVSEFMFMFIDGNGVANFKHAFTRNAVFLHPDGRLEVPQTDIPLLLGYFDAAPEC